MNQNEVSGSLLVLYLYNVAEAIRLDDLRRTLRAPLPKREPHFRQPAPEYVRFVTPPVLEHLPALDIEGAPGIAARLAWYEYGIVSILLEIPFEGSWTQIAALASRWMDAPDLERQALSIVRRHVDRSKDAIFNPYPDWLMEDYCITHLRHAPNSPSATELLQQFPREIAQIVRGEVAEFSPTELAEILDSPMSYYPNDLLVVGWSAALVYDTPEGAAPTIQLLEYANSQLLEFRHYDTVLTTLLSEAYRALERGGPFRRWRLAREAEHLSTIRLDIRELVERLDNSIKFLSDIFAARL